MCLTYHVYLVGIKRSDDVGSFKIITLSLLSLLKVRPLYAMRRMVGAGRAKAISALILNVSIDGSGQLQAPAT